MDRQILAAIGSLSGGGDVYLVGTGGVDAAGRDGKTWDTRWLTGDYAVGRTRANRGDTILLFPATYDEVITLDVATTRILGVDRDRVTGMRFTIGAHGVEIGNLNPGKTGGAQFACGAAYQNVYIHDILVNGLTLTNKAIFGFANPGPNYGIIRDIDILNTNCGTAQVFNLLNSTDGMLLERIRIIGCTAANMIYFEGGVGSECSWNVIKDCVITNNTGNGINLTGNCQFTTVKDCVIQGNSGTNILNAGTGNHFARIPGAVPTITWSGAMNGSSQDVLGSAANPYEVVGGFGKLYLWMDHSAWQAGDTIVITVYQKVHGTPGLKQLDKITKTHAAGANETLMVINGLPIDTLTGYHVTAQRTAGTGTGTLYARGYIEFE